LLKNGWKKKGLRRRGKTGKKIAVGIQMAETNKGGGKLKEGGPLKARGRGKKTEPCKVHPGG